MDFLIHIDITRGDRSKFILANNADPDEIPHYAVFHPDLHYLPKYLCTGIKNEKKRLNYNTEATSLICQTI